MTKTQTGGQPSRREILMGLGAGGLAVATVTLLPVSARADSAAVAEAIKERVGDASPEEGRITIELPQIAENGNTVPLTIEVDSPMTEQDYCKAVHVFAEENPLPNVASFRFTPACGQAVAITLSLIHI